MSRGAGRALTAVGLVFALAMIAGGTSSVISLFWLRSEDSSVTYAAASALAVSSECGDVTVQAGDAQEIVVKTHIWWSFSKPTVTSQQVGDSREVHVDCPGLSFGVGNSANVTIVVPADTSLTVDANAGRVDVRGLAGSITVTSDAGEVRASSLRSPTVTAKSSAGAVRLSFTLAPQTVVATSSAGRVDVLVPDGTETYRVDARSSAGSTYVRVKTDPAAARSIEAHSSAGPVRVDYLS